MSNPTLPPRKAKDFDPPNLLLGTLAPQVISRDVLSIIAAYHLPPAKQFDPPNLLLTTLAPVVPTTVVNRRTLGPRVGSRSVY